MIERTTPPCLHSIRLVGLLQAETKQLDNRVPVYLINAGTQDVVKIEFLFDAGRWYQNSPLISSVANSLMDEGTRNHSAEELAEELDFFGSYLDQDSGYDFSNITLFSLNKHVAGTLPLLEEIIKTPVFPAKEYEIHLRNRKQNFTLSNRKVDVVARRRFRNLLFGDTHAYGYELKSSDFDNMERSEVICFYEKAYKAGNCRIIISGKIPGSLLSELNSRFGGNDWIGPNQAVPPLHKETGGMAKKNTIKKKTALQSAIIIGRTLFNRTHPDYRELQVVNTILGGYFGSRLMRNIREEKGYTYGIHSALVSLQHAGYFYVESEVASEFSRAAVDEIYKELKLLRTEPIPETELNSVKNYMMGQFLRSIDGPFALAERFHLLLEYGLDYSYYNKYWEVIKTITPSRVLELAGKYLQEDDMYELVVGN